MNGNNKIYSWPRQFDLNHDIDFKIIRTNHNKISWKLKQVSNWIAWAYSRSKIVKAAQLSIGSWVSTKLLFEIWFLIKEKKLLFDSFNNFESTRNNKNNTTIKNDDYFHRKGQLSSKSEKRQQQNKTATAEKNEPFRLRSWRAT